MSMRASVAAAAALGACLCFLSTAAFAQVDLLSPDTVSGQADLRLAASDGEKSWVQGGFGATRYGGADDGWVGHATLASADLFWKPAIGDLSGYFDGVWQPDQRRQLDLQEGFALYKPLPRPDGWRWQARAGLMYPNISMENDGPGWTPTRTITPSAINSWVGEEVKVRAVEGQLAKRWDEQEVSAALAVFSHDDTAGTMLAWRGWSLSDVRSTAFGSLPIPQVPQAHKAFSAQDPYSVSLDEIDGRPGFYGRLEWRAPEGVTANVFYYDNAGDRTSLKDGQWTWDTWFWNAGLRYAPDADTELLAQAMTGRTVTGFYTSRGWRVDANFDAVYLLADRKVGRDLFTGRLDWFDVRDNSFQTLDDNNERGWALTADWRHTLTDHLAVLLEALQVQSDRPARAYVGDDAYQAQTTVQAALKMSF